MSFLYMRTSKSYPFRKSLKSICCSIVASAIAVCSQAGSAADASLSKPSTVDVSKAQAFVKRASDQAFLHGNGAAAAVAATQGMGGDSRGISVHVFLRGHLTTHPSIYRCTLLCLHLHQFNVRSSDAY
jgi:hypothetical protein